ncbi:MAG: hypothetical protein WA691_06655 [Thermoplasmata archaeon]
MTEPSAAPSDAVSPPAKALDSGTVEVLAHALFRTVFREGMRVPIRMEGLVDMDVVVQDNNLLLNMNHLPAELPQLAIWRITLAFQGEPVVEYGRGVRNDVKIHLPRLCFLLLAGWAARRRGGIARARADAAHAHQLTAMLRTDSTAGTVREPRV